MGRRDIQAVYCLNSEQHEAFSMYWEGNSVAQIGQALNMTTSHAGKVLDEARDHVYSTMAEKERPMAFLQNNMAARKKAPAKPEAVPVNTICSVCGLPWTDHGKDPTTDDCIRLLKAELARRPYQVPIQVPLPYPVPVPWRPYGPYWGEWYSTHKAPITITCGGEPAEKTSTYGGTAYNECTPKLLCTTASPSL